MSAPTTFRSRRLGCRLTLLVWLLPISKAFLTQSSNIRLSVRLLSQPGGGGLRPDPMGLSSSSSNPRESSSTFGGPTPRPDPFQRQKRSGPASSFPRDSSDPSLLDNRYNKNNNEPKRRGTNDNNRPPYIPQPPSSSSSSSSSSTSASFVDKVMNKVRTSQSFPSNRQSQQRNNQNDDRREENTLRSAFDKFGNAMGSASDSNISDNSSNKFGMNPINNNRNDNRSPPR